MKLSEMKKLAQNSYKNKSPSADLSLLNVVKNNCKHEKPVYISPKPVFSLQSRKQLIKLKRQGEQL